MEIIKINNLHFKYSGKVIFDDLNLNIEENFWYTLLGSNGCGKSTLIKIITGLIPADNVFINNINVIENTYEIRKLIGTVFENPDNNLICETVIEELTIPLENINLKETEIKKRIKNISKSFKIEHLLNKTISELTIVDKQVIALASVLITNPKILILDEAFTYLDINKKNELLKFLKNINLTVINITHDIEDTLYGDNIIILENGKIVINEKKEKVFEKENLLKKYGMPFIVDLSNKLKYYGLLDKTVYSYKEMADIIWK